MIKSIGLDWWTTLKDVIKQWIARGGVSQAILGTSDLPNELQAGKSAFVKVDHLEQEVANVLVVVLPLEQCHSALKTLQKSSTYTTLLKLEDIYIQLLTYGV